MTMPFRDDVVPDRRAPGGGPGYRRITLCRRLRGRVPPATGATKKLVNFFWARPAVPSETIQQAAQIIAFILGPGLLARPAANFVQKVLCPAIHVLAL